MKLKRWKFITVVVLIGLLLFSQFGIHLPTDIHEIPDSGDNLGDISLVFEQNAILVGIYVSQDSHDNTIYVEMGGDEYSQPFDVKRRFKVPFNRRATHKDVEVMWYRKVGSTEVVEDPGQGNYLSARVIIHDGKHVLFNHLESFVEKKNTIEGWAIRHCKLFGTCDRYGIH